MDKADYPLVSFVTPTYNQADYLAVTIDSVLAQDYPNVEYLVLDDGSTDNTPEVLSRYDGKIRWERQANLGQAATLNKGWSMVSGKYIGYISSDDLLLPNAFTDLVAVLEANPEIEVVYGDYDIIDGKGVPIVPGFKTADYEFRGVVEDLTCHPGPAAVFRRTLLERIGGWDSKLRFVPDFEFFLRAAQVGPFLRVKKVVAQYRVHDESGSVRPIAYERSMEIVETMKRYWGQDRGPAARRSMARAHHKAACSHIQSGRFLAAFQQLLKAFEHRPRTIVSRSLWLRFVKAVREGPVARTFAARSR